MSIAKRMIEEDFDNRWRELAKDRIAVLIVRLAEGEDKYNILLLIDQLRQVVVDEEGEIIF